MMMEHETGLILLDAPTTTAPTSSDNNVIAVDDTPTLPPTALTALRALRDSNPSLQRKLNHGISDDDVSSSLDEKLGYWNRYNQKMVLLSPDNKELIGVNLGGLMIRLVNCVPFFQAIEDTKCKSLYSSPDVKPSVTSSLNTLPKFDLNKQEDFGDSITSSVSSWVSLCTPNTLASARHRVMIRTRFSQDSLAIGTISQGGTSFNV